jgi:hypothetical protein
VRWAAYPGIVAIQLDPVGAVANLVADDAREGLNAVGFLGALQSSSDLLDRLVASVSITRSCSMKQAC